MTKVNMTRWLSQGWFLASFLFIIVGDGLRWLMTEVIKNNIDIKYES